MIADYHFTHRLPLRERVVDALMVKPKILEWKPIIDRVTDRLLSLLDAFDDR